MDQFCLNDQTSLGKPEQEKLLREIREARTQPVFRTYVQGSMRATICTTNEKAHLALGKLSERALSALVKLFEERTRMSDQFVFSYESAEGQVQPRNLFVTSSQDDAQIRVFHIAPGH